MASFLTNHAPIVCVQTTNNATDLTNATNEKSGQTFLFGVPVQVNAGFIQEWDGATVAKGIWGISLEDAHNLATNGQGAPGPFTGIGFPGTGTTFGSVPFEASAVNIPRGAPFVTGYILSDAAVQETIFSGQTDNNTYTNAASITPTQAMVGTQFGLTKDASGHWYVDLGKVTVGTNTVVEMIQLDPIDGSIPNARVWFVITKAASQYVQ